MARAIEQRLAEGGEEDRAAFKARVKSLVEDVPDLPDFQRFHDAFRDDPKSATRSEEHTSELQSLMRISYAVFCLNKKTTSKLCISYTCLRNKIKKETTL